MHGGTQPKSPKNYRTPWMWPPNYDQFWIPLWKRDKQTHDERVLLFLIIFEVVFVEAIWRKNAEVNFYISTYSIFLYYIRPLLYVKYEF